jgi:hypothetical protein
MAKSPSAVKAHCAGEIIRRIETRVALSKGVLYPWRGVFGGVRLGNFQFFHGSVFGENATRDMAEMHGNVVHAHTHRPAIATGRRDDFPIGIGVGTLTRRAEAGYANGFETTLSFDLGGATVSEPASILIQESLAQIGIKAQLNKVPGANWRAALLKKDMPLILNRFGGWLNYPEYFFFWCYHGQNAVFNTMSYQSPEMDKLIDAARFETDPKRYSQQVQAFVQKAYDEVPRIPLAQPNFDVAMQKNVQGYVYWFHLQPDYRSISKT